MAATPGHASDSAVRSEIIGSIEAFVRESNRIEGILRDPTQAEIDATARFVYETEPTVDALTSLVAVYAPGHILRRGAHQNVRVGNHIAPLGGAAIASALNEIIERAIDGDDAWRVHNDYETLHPFTDGNGRSGRALWAWMMQYHGHGFPLGFLHQFYYQTLENYSGRNPNPAASPNGHGTETCTPQASQPKGGI